MQKGDTIITDKGYYSYKNYQLSVSRYQIIPLIFPKSDFKLEKALNLLSYPITSYRNSKLGKRTKSLFQNLKKEFKSKMEKWTCFKAIRSIIEDMFKLAKKSLSLDKIHRYTQKSVAKFISLNVLLLGTIISLGNTSKEQLQHLAEW